MYHSQIISSSSRKMIRNAENVRRDSPIPFMNMAFHNNVIQVRLGDFAREELGKGMDHISPSILHGFFIIKVTK